MRKVDFVVRKVDFVVRKAELGAVMLKGLSSLLSINSLFCHNFVTFFATFFTQCVYCRVKTPDRSQQSDFFCPIKFKYVHQSVCH